jgi:Rieske Fe-S protein
VSDDNANPVRLRGPLNRRTVLAAGGAATASAAMLAVAGCATYSSSSPSPAPANPNTTGAASPPAQGAGDTAQAPAAEGGTVLGAASGVPVGGGKIFEDQAVVVTQPTAGTFHAFSAICTHQGCTVGEIEDGQIICPCHMSHFSIKDGSNTQGPNGSPAGSVQPLAKKKVTAKGSQLSIT